MPLDRATTRWDPDHYARHDDERARPFHDLLARVDRTTAAHVVDFGCGPGNLTALLAERWPGAVIDGVDSSAEMIAVAQTHAAPRVRFTCADAASWSVASDVDVIVSSALLQWIPDHLPLVRSWCDALPADGWLAFHVPGNFGSAAHVLMRDLAASAPWRDRLDGVLRTSDPTCSPAQYAEVLMDAGLVTDVWETTYSHVLSGADPVLDWVRGTGLRPVLSALDASAAGQFEAEYGALLRDAFPAGPHGTILPFRRVFAVGRKT